MADDPPWPTVESEELWTYRSEYQRVIDERYGFSDHAIHRQYWKTEYSHELSTTWQHGWVCKSRLGYKDAILFSRMDKHELALGVVARRNHGRQLAFKNGYCPNYATLADAMTEPVCSCLGC
jgi:hypothetical protein